MEDEDGVVGPGAQCNKAGSWGQPKKDWAGARLQLNLEIQDEGKWEAGPDREGMMKQRRDLKP